MHPLSQERVLCAFFPRKHNVDFITLLANGKRNDDKCLLIESRISRLNSQLHEVASRLEESIAEIESNERVNSEKFIWYLNNI